jgi:hypothetical protein
MSETLSLVDRLRIERVVWTLDQRLYDLPRKSRIAKRREVRENLRVAAADVGTSDAIRNLGNTQRLAAEYRAAEFGDAPRPAWMAAAVFLLTAQLFFTAFLAEATNAFGDGIKAANPAATGTFTWSGLGYVQDTVTYTFVNGRGSSVGGAWTPFAWLLWGIATVCVGRLWRVASLWRRHQAAAAEAS